MDIFLAILAALCLVTGLIGAVLPLPGPPLSFFGLLLLHWTRFAEFTPGTLWGLGVATALVTVLDYVVPMWGVKKFGGSKAGVWGSTIGMVAGLALGPFGIFLGAFLGGLVAEMMVGRDSRQAFRAALGSFAGFLFGVGLKLILCFVMIWYALRAVIGYY